MITLHRQTIDGIYETKRYKTLKGAQAYAVKWMGQHPDIGTHYATDAYGVATLTVEGVTLAALFGVADEAAEGYGPSDHAPWRLSHGRYGTYEQYQSDPGCDGDYCGDPSHESERKAEPEAPVQECGHHARRYGPNNYVCLDCFAHIDPDTGKAVVVEAAPDDGLPF